MEVRRGIGRWRSIGFAGKYFTSLRANKIALLTEVDRRDAFTTSADFIISAHPAAKNLYIATCGNFHGWKFFPVLGKYIVQMLEDQLEPELKEKWAWDRERPADGKANADYPRHEMRNLMDRRGEARL